MLTPQLKTKQYFTTCLFLLCVSFISCATSEEDSVTPPNIVIFLVDDMGVMDTSVPFLVDSSGAPQKLPLNFFYRTPNMEELATQGVRFTNFYAHSVSSPSRATILTGQNSARHGITNWIHPSFNNRGEFGPTDWNWEGLNKQSVTLPRLLQQNGYTTIHVGKGSFAPFDAEGEDPRNLGFDINIAGGSWRRPTSYYGQDAYGNNFEDNIENAIKGLEKYHGEDVFLTEALTLEAKAEISAAHEQGKPFFLHLSHYAVHNPYQPDPRFIDNYIFSNRSEKEQAYAALVEGVDQSLGDVVDHIRELGIGENTLILFLGDNGSNAPLQNPIWNALEPLALRGRRGTPDEGGIRVPFLASWVTPNDEQPNQKQLPIQRNGVQSQFGSIMDLFPTLLNVADITPPRGHVVDGFMLHEQLAGQRNEQRREVFLNHFPHETRTRRFDPPLGNSYVSSLVDSSGWKVMYHYRREGVGRYQLVNLKEDPFEIYNRSVQNPGQLKRMMKLLKREMVATNALLPEVNQQPLRLIIP